MIPRSRGGFRPPIAPQVEATVDTSPITLVELEAAIRACKKGRAPGTDESPAEAWVALNSGAKKVLLTVFNKAWEGRPSTGIGRMPWW